jgi:hypothetical protein
MDSLVFSHPAVNSMCLFILSTVRLDALWLPELDIFSTLPRPLALLPGHIVMMRFPFHRPGPICLLPSTPPLRVAVADVCSGLLEPRRYFFLKPHLPGRLQATANALLSSIKIVFLLLLHMQSFLHAARCKCVDLLEHTCKRLLLSAHVFYPPLEDVW